jgi:hypothetical protein
MSKFSLNPQKKLFSLNMDLSLTAHHFLGKDLDAKSIGEKGILKAPVLQTCLYSLKTEHQ